ncbi:hypothetical protein BOTBODRAFT_35328 [Botryobasidium botryosum FD-172 SS1]|uniref:Squalene/phytoene synthase n=1 Tax=Botryobasidium botryosum (strain FD-172 SS1) TaxID=930990 RepID=A0A067MIR7_BOTB1|nr:hypothetical protein BOTBODRAFT_35328 [Botryobasidium botryosum FD-172 SS1]
MILSARHRPVSNALRHLQRRHVSQARTGGIQDPAAYCRDLVRKHDNDAFLCSYFYPRHLQGAYFGLRAFNVELATVKENVSRTMIGQMRMQFWRDAVKGISEDKPPNHPIALALHAASKQASLPGYHLKRMIDAREQDLQNPTYMTVESLQNYAESTSSTLLYLLLSLLSLSSSSTLSHAASHLGIAHSFATLLRAMPFHASQGRVIIPAEITSKHGVTQEEVVRKGGSAPGIDDAVYEFATLANDHLITARESFKDGGVPDEAMPIFLTGIPVASYLSRLEAVNFDAFHPSLQTKDWKLPFQIWRGRRSRMF